VEVKDVDLPDELRRAMAREAEADREARALLINSDAELRVSRVLSEAAAVMAQHPQAMQLRFLQTVAEVATERNSTLVMPVPVDLLSLFARGGGGAGPDGRPAIPSPPAPSGAGEQQAPPASPRADDERRPGEGNGRPG
jgi:hypothetical protein